MKKKISISELCDLLDSRHFENIEPGIDTTSFSSERIRELAFAKLREDESVNTYKKESNMKNSFKMLLIAAVIFAMSITAFAAFGGIDYFKAIFGDSAENVSDSIQTPLVSAENDDYRMTVESLLSDGFKTDIIISLALKNGAAITDDPIDIFTWDIIGDEEVYMDSMSCDEMPDFSSENKTFYHMSITSIKNSSNGKIKLTMVKANDLVVTVDVGSSLTHKEIAVNPGDYADKNFRLETIQLSPMGALIIGNETEQKGSLPQVEVFIKMKDGSTHEVFSHNSFDYEDDGETIMGGGGLVIPSPWDEVPLVTETMGSRNPENDVVLSASFSRILNLQDVEEVLVDGVAYKIAE